MKTCFQLFLSFILVHSFISCNNVAGNRDTSSQPTVEQLANEKLEEPALSDSLPSAVIFDTDSAVTPTGTRKTGFLPAAVITHDWDKKIIKSADLTLQVKDFKTVSQQVHQQVRQWGGYIAGEEQVKQEDRQEVSITIKVPVAQFEDLMLAISANNGEIEKRTITTDDVSTQLIDTKLRLETKKRARLKYLELMQASKNVTEVLQVQSEVDAIQEAIEGAEGRIQLLNHQAALSTIHVTIYQPISGERTAVDQPGLGSRILSAFTKGSAVIGELAVFLIALWPLWIALLFAWWYYKKINRFRSNSTTIKS